MTLLSRLEAGEPTPCRPWPRYVVNSETWTALAAAPEPALLALWGDPQQVHALLRQDGDILLASVQVESGDYPALSPCRPLAARFEQAIADLWGHRAKGGPVTPLLDHGAWAQAAPLSARPTPSGAATPLEFAPVDDDGIHQLALGPVLPDAGESVHRRASIRGDVVTRLESRFGYLHKGTLSLMRGKSPRAAARFAARLAGDATVAHSIAFARAAEAATGSDAPPHAEMLRGVMAEIERICGHLATNAATAEAAGAVLAAQRFAWHHEALLTAADIAFGHRLMMDCVIPGGVAADIAPGGDGAILTALARLAAELPDWGGGMLARRLAGIAVVTPDLAAAFAASGPVARAAGQCGDAAARFRLRLREIEASDLLLRGLLQDLPGGDVTVPLGAGSGEGIAVTESAQGEVWHWLRLEGGQIGGVFACDPGWSHFPLLEQAMIGTETNDFALAVASFGGSVSGVDL